MSTNPDLPGPAHGQRRQMTTSARGLDDLSACLARWLGHKVGADVRITSITRPEGAGLSSSSVLFDASWDTVDGQGDAGAFVARMAPEETSFPVFQSYDLAMQYEVISGVAAASDVPVPRLCWLEPDERPLGTPFFVMQQVLGRVPADNPPYVFAGWLAEASPAERAGLQQRTVDIVARIHAISDSRDRFPLLAKYAAKGGSLRTHADTQHSWYKWALADDGYRIPVIDRGFAWLAENWPDEVGPDVLNWGDARPGNVIYQGFKPAAVLDWEMAALGPREVDVAWMIFIHRFFQDIGKMFNHPGLPDFLRRADVVESYQEATGHTLRHLDFYLLYAALRHAIVMARIKRRMIHFDGDAVPDNPDDYVLHRDTLDAMITGRYSWD
ncbi:MAG TPA: phosphotransferase family protein [Pseudonocardiaceae bacterium]|nr:phosphotransferase family protein [Pseudonocardiaceae bacterium]